MQELATWTRCSLGLCRHSRGLFFSHENSHVRFIHTVPPHSNCCLKALYVWGRTTSQMQENQAQIVDKHNGDRGKGRNSLSRRTLEQKQDHVWDSHQCQPVVEHPRVDADCSSQHTQFGKLEEETN